MPAGAPKRKDPTGAPRRVASGAAGIAADPAKLKLLLGSPHGLLFLCVFAVEGVVGAVIFSAASGEERLGALAIFAVLILATLLVFWRLSLPAPAAPVAQTIVPANLTQEAPPAKGDGDGGGTDDDLINHIDGTFAIAQPPANWQMRTTTLEAEAGRVLQGQRIGAGVDLSRIQLPYKAGPLLALNEQHVYKIHYLPGQSEGNGRPIAGLLDEVISDFVHIFSVSKAGMTMRDVTAEHLFALLLAEKSMGGYRVTEIREAQSGAQKRTLLRATLELAYERVSIDGGPPQRATIFNHLHVVERAEFIYVINSVLVAGVPSEAARRSEIEAIIASMTPRRAADAADRGKREREVADAQWQEAVASLLPQMLVSKADAIIAAIRRDNPVDLSREAGEFAQLAAYGHAMPQLTSAELTNDIDRWSAAITAAARGDRTALAGLLASTAPPPDVAEVTAPYPTLPSAQLDTSTPPS